MRLEGFHAAVEQCGPWLELWAWVSCCDGGLHRALMTALSVQANLRGQPLGHTPLFLPELMGLFVCVSLVALGPFQRLTL